MSKQLFGKNLTCPLPGCTEKDEACNGCPDYEDTPAAAQSPKPSDEELEMAKNVLDFLLNRPSYEDAEIGRGMDISEIAGALHRHGAEQRRLGRAEAFEEAAKMTIEATEIPKSAIRRGTGVRDQVVCFGERFSQNLLFRAEQERKGGR